MPDFRWPLPLRFARRAVQPPSHTYSSSFRLSIFLITSFTPWHPQITPGILGTHFLVFGPSSYKFNCNPKHSPWVILNDFGGAFAMGAVGGGIWHGIKGARNSPRVCNPRPP